MAFDVFAQMGEIEITGLGTYDLTVPGLGPANRMKAIIMWSSTQIKNSIEETACLNYWYGVSSSEGLSENGNVMGGCPMSYNNLGTSIVSEQTDSGASSGNWRLLTTDRLRESITSPVGDLYDMEAQVRYTLVPTIRGTQVAGPILNGWRINVWRWQRTTPATPGGIDISLDRPIHMYYCIIGGRDVECNVFDAQFTDNVGTRVQAHGLTNPVNVLGFTHTTARNVGGSSFQHGIRQVFGAFHWDGTNITQVSACTDQTDGDGTPQANDTFSKDSIVRRIKGASDWHGQISAFDSTNITLETIDPFSVDVLNEFMGVFVISLPAEAGAWVGTYTLPTSAGIFTPKSQPGFQPDLYGILATGGRPSEAFDGATGDSLEMLDQPWFGNWSYGMVDKSLTQGCASFIHDGHCGTDNTTCASITTPSLVYSRYYDGDEGDISSPREMNTITVSTSPFTSEGVTFSADDVSGAHGGLVIAWAMQTDERADDEVPVIRGRELVGETLTVDTECIDPLLGSGYYAFQWYRDGVPIEGATDSSYDLTEDDFGHDISVEVTFTDTGGDIIRISSGPTGAIRVDTRKSLATPQGALDTAGTRPTPEVYQWMNRVSKGVSDLERSGGSDERPVKDRYPGMPYYDTTLKKPIWYTGFSDNWVDATGTTV